MSPWLSDLFLGSQSDERLVSLARAGHERAFVLIVERYKRELHAFARRIGPKGRADDVLQEAFLRAFAALQAGAEVEHLRGWLYQIVRNASIKAATRARAEMELHDEVIAADGLEDEVERRLLTQGVLVEVARLPERQRDAFVKTAVQGRSRSEVALSMGLTEGAVRQLVRRARASLRTAVTAITPFPLAQWLAAARPAPGTDRIAEVAVGVGTTSAGGLALKLGVVVVSGVVAHGVAPSPHQTPDPHRAAPSQPPAALSQASIQAPHAAVTKSAIRRGSSGQGSTHRGSASSSSSPSEPVRAAANSAQSPGGLSRPGSGGSRGSDESSSKSNHDGSSGGSITGAEGGSSGHDGGSSRNGGGAGGDGGQTSTGTDARSGSD